MNIGPKKLRIVCISDTHGMHRKLRIPPGDVLVHAGDISMRGEEKTIRDFDQWLGELPHKHKVVICGNHDFCFEIKPELAKTWMTNAHYLQDQSVIIEGLKFYGSPWQPTFHNWAFNKDRGEKIKTEWDKIPSDTDVLITHGPPFGILDKTVDNRKVGCEELLLAVNRIKPKIHIFGHIHENYGEIKLNGTHFINPSSCDYNYIPRQQPIVVDYIYGQPAPQAPKVFEMSDPKQPEPAKEKKKEVSDEKESSEE